jgi:hypothetical protein
MTSLEAPSLHAQFARSVAVARAHFETHFLQPLFISVIENAWVHGALPLPDLGWGRRDPWYRGDLL